ncbi:hypothetical protein ENBRE01_0377 [Enteropsectra breve]|nr:hypothetical protein ENBRE01_0377 [Enteropsectra breve]
MSSECSNTSDEFDFVVEKTAYNDTALDYYHKDLCYLDDMRALLQEAECLFSARADEYILGFIALVKFSSFSAHLGSNMKEGFERLMKMNLLSEDTPVVVHERLLNTPGNIALDLYKEIPVCFENILFLSKVYKMDKHGLDSVSKLFPEIDRERLKRFPYKNEEIFLCKSKKVEHIEQDGVKFNICLLSRDEYIRFVSDFEKETSENPFHK